MRRHMADMGRMNDEQRVYRRTVLGTLTPEHRQLLSRLVGDLAVAPEPELEGTVRQLNSALSLRESQRIVALDKEHEAAMVRHFQQTAAETIAEMGTAAHQPSVQLHASMQLHPPPLSYGGPVVPSAPFGNDAASILVRTAATMLMMPGLISSHPSIR